MQAQILSMREFEEISLPNGIRLVHKQVSATKIAHIGVMIGVGSRDEELHQQGITHFWEHMAFKGTSRRKSFHIINRLESLGGELNAYTTKEKICFYASCLDQHLGKSVELLQDIVFNATFPEKQIERERKVILEEMAMYHDSPEDAILDEFDEIVFEGHALGRNILGTTETVGRMTRDMLVDFVKDKVDTSKIVISSVGNYPLKKVERHVMKYFAPLKATSSTYQRSSFVGYKPQAKEKNRDISQFHSVIGFPGYSQGHPKRLPLFLLANILGGPSMNSRLNMALRERHGLVYGIEANYLSYTDAGLLTISFATDQENHKKAMSIIKKEINLLKENKLGIRQLSMSKDQLMGQMGMAEENNVSMMLGMAKSLLDLDRIENLSNIFSKIRAITAEELLEVANEIITLDSASTLHFVPQKNGNGFYR